MVKRCAVRKRSVGRSAGGHNRGYWFRKGRGWYISEGQKIRPLTDQAGDQIKAENTPNDVLQDAYARYRLGMDEQSRQSTTGNGALVLTAVMDYLKHSQAKDRLATFNKRGEFLFDFCFGLPCRFWDYGVGRKVAKPSAHDYLHDGFGNKRVAEIIPMDVQNWLDKHPTWGKSTQRIAIQSVKRAFNYCLKMGLIPTNPVKGMTAPTGRKRITYFTDEQEEALYEHASKPMALLIKVAVRTGARYGAEIAALTARHVEETPEGMLWRFSADENKTGSKTGKSRVIYVPAEIADLVRELVKKHPSGSLFRNRNNTPWKVATLKENFSRLKDKLAAKGIELDADACLYSCRHTYAKRMLGGYWTGEPITLEILAGLMGNTPQVCYDHYAKWCGDYIAPLWKAVNGRDGKKR